MSDKVSSYESQLRNGSTGKFADRLPEHMRADYWGALSRKDPLNMLDEIALLDTRALQLAEQVSFQVNVDFWAEMGRMVMDARRQIRHGTPDEAELTLGSLEEMMGVGEREAATWERSMELVALRMKLVKEERRHVRDRETLYTVQDGLALVQSLLQSVRLHVRDRESLDAIYEDFDYLTREQDEDVVLEVDPPAPVQHMIAEAPGMTGVANGQE